MRAISLTPRRCCICEESTNLFEYLPGVGLGMACVACAIHAGYAVKYLNLTPGIQGISIFSYLHRNTRKAAPQSES